MKNPYIRVTKEFRFEMAHALWEYDGPCKNIHGHSYELKVTVAGNPISAEGHPKLGMVIDFGDLKKIVRKAVVDVFDHALLLNKDMPAEVTKNLSRNFGKVMLMDYQPTSEMMVADFAGRIQAILPEELELKHLLLRETATAYAEWYPEEN
jgi:6-pyruvoyltetrahydropterin/6-carboxytetrahydropterin synthase